MFFQSGKLRFRNVSLEANSLDGVHHCCFVVSASVFGGARAATRGAARRKKRSLLFWKVCL
jgi:hypothetical protein